MELPDLVNQINAAMAGHVPTVRDEQIDLSWIGGNCPVQAEGEIGGKNFYFRARGDSWSMGIGGDAVVSPNWYHEEEWGDGPYDAGWMPQHIALGMVAKAIGLYLATPTQEAPK